MASPQKRGLAATDEATRARVARLGGQAAQRSGRAHKLTLEERRRGGRHSSGNFRNRPAAEVKQIARQGGLASQSRRSQQELSPTP